MKVVLIALQKFGAAPIDSLEISNAFCRNNVFHHLIISSGNEIKDEFIDNDFRKVWFIETFESNSLSFLFNTLKLKFLKLLRIIINIKPDFIYITHRHPWTLFIIILKPFLKFKLFYTYHDNPWDKKEKENLILIFIDKMLGKLSDLIVVHSYFMKENLKKYLKKEIFVMPLGPYFIFEKYKKENFNLEKELNLGFLGRIFPYKGLEVLLKAVNELQEEGLKINCFILGKGNLSDKEKELIEKTNSIIENRWLDNKEIINFCSKKIDVVVLPYKMASQSGVISLCLAIGIPLIVSNVGGLKEFVKDGFNGFVFDIRDINELKNKIKKIYFNRSLLIEFSKNIDLIKKEFDWAKYIKEFADKFLSIP